MQAALRRDHHDLAVAAHRDEVIVEPRSSTLHKCRIPTIDREVILVASLALADKRGLEAGCFSTSAARTACPWESRERIRWSRLQQHELRARSSSPDRVRARETLSVARRRFVSALAPFMGHLRT